MRESHRFGKRTENTRIPNPKDLKPTFGITENDTYTNTKIKQFIKQTTSIDIDEYEINKNEE